MTTPLNVDWARVETAVNELHEYFLNSFDMLAREVGGRARCGNAATTILRLTPDSVRGQPEDGGGGN